MMQIGTLQNTLSGDDLAPQSVAALEEARKERYMAKAQPVTSGSAGCSGRGWL